MDDCIITKVSDTEFYVVLNAGCKEKDLAYFESVLKSDVTRKSVQI